MSFFSRLTAGLAKTSSGISEGISGIFTKSRLDDAMLEQLEELLIMADMGVSASAAIAAEFGKERFDKDISEQQAKEALAGLLAQRLTKVALPLIVSSSRAAASGVAIHLSEGAAEDGLPRQAAGLSRNDGTIIILVVGVNGNGKTTTIGKLAAQFAAQGKKVMLCAADTFRAAAVEQLKVWGQRTGCEVIAGTEGADPASVAYAAVEQAKAQGVDVLMIDTAGRLHNKQNLMAELEKIVKVIRKVDASAPHHVLQVLDATTGQNALAQVKAFKELVDVTGLIITKLDGTARAGVVVALADAFGLPIHAVGVGEGVEDLQGFSPDDFARNLVGLAA